MKYRSRFQSGLTMLTGLFLLAVLFAILLYAITPETPAARGPILLASFIAILLGSLLCILFLLRWLLRPYNQLVGEAQRASTASVGLKSQDEAEFVLETFQSVVAQLQEQRKELEQQHRNPQPTTRRIRSPAATPARSILPPWNASLAALRCARSESDWPPPRCPPARAPRHPRFHAAP